MEEESLVVGAAASMTMAEHAVDATPIIIRASSAGKVDDFMLLLLLCCCCCCCRCRAT